MSEKIDYSKGVYDAKKLRETAANGLHPGMVSGILYKVRQGRREQNVSFDFAERVFCLPVPFFESAPED